MMEAAMKAQKFAEEMGEMATKMERVSVKVTEAANSGTRQGQEVEKAIKYGMKGFAAASGTLAIVGGIVGLHSPIPPSWLAAREALR